MTININAVYHWLLNEVLTDGDVISTRNSEVTTTHLLPEITFDKFPLITVRKTQWKKAIQEMEWFVSGKERCPDELLNWWSGQLDPEGYYINGYSTQFRYSSCCADYNEYTTFDQIKFILEGLRNNPNSRRLLMTVWNPGEMATITEANDNANTPTCCHSIIVQFFVRSGRLHMKTYQRSADMLLGVPHNWVQSWALLLYFATHAGLEVGSMTWMWGDAHIYNEESHLATVKAINDVHGTEIFLNNATYFGMYNNIELRYNPTDRIVDGIPEFKADDFYIVGDIPKPAVTLKPKLL